MSESCHAWVMSHMNESWHTYHRHRSNPQKVMSRMWNKSCHIWVMSHVSHVTYEWVMAHISQAPQQSSESHVTHVEWVMSRMSHVTRESCHIWVMSHVNESWHIYTTHLSNPQEVSHLDNSYRSVFPHISLQYFCVNRKILRGVWFVCRRVLQCVAVCCSVL